ncbi:DNA mismatch repair protein Msh3-like isoform X1 [Schistocerca gregaria]|uniref:DNA mismatch repair protein Msh3-like isoform X1 n=1 Tax=Schistocerca gregaria TaxID=7010 RepID=UPI00211DEEAC|nr:DNA mismatch repair protein Msh3-like isoform X1 [Schistocerca gregaria]
MSVGGNLSQFARNSSVSLPVQSETKRQLVDDEERNEGPSRSAKEKRVHPPSYDTPKIATLTENHSQLSSVKSEADVEIDESDVYVDCEAGDINSCHSYKSQSVSGLSRSEIQAQKSKKNGLTALEKQVLGLKQQHPGMILMIQNGYKYHFYEEDAEIASKLLEIATFRLHNFLQACVPVARLKYYVYQFVEKGYKVGVVNQTETTALKAAGENRNAPFSRELSCVYSRATLIGDDVNPQAFEGNCLMRERKPSCILSLCEDNTGNKTTIGIATFDPSTGEAIYDSFDDLKTREELEKRLAHLNPAEILSQETLSTSTETLLKHSGACLERLSDEEYEFSKALAVVAVFLSSPNDKPIGYSEPVLTLNELTPIVIRALGALWQHLAQFKLQDGMSAARLTSFTSLEKHLQLSASALQNLEVFASSSGDERGSLLSIMDHTRTAFGKRLLEQWMSQPSRDISELLRRQDAVQELINPNCRVTPLLGDILKGLPDLDRGLTNVAYHRCTTNNFYRLIEALSFIYQSLEVIAVVTEAYVQSSLIRELITDITVQLRDVKEIMNILNPSAAKIGDKTSILNDYSEFPNVLRTKTEIKALENELDELRPSIAETLGVPLFYYITVAGQEYLIQAKKDVQVPLDWILVNQTKTYRRYRSPQVISILKQLCQLREKVEADCEEAWRNVVDQFNKDYIRHKKSVKNLAALDVLLSFSEAAKLSDYCRPKLIESVESEIHIKNGRHPVLSRIMEESGHFIPNDSYLKSSEPMVLSGPNMGGKSCYVRQVALLVIMAHTGSFIPAEYATISILDAVYVWMGAGDNILQRKSTFMVEAEGASNILNQATTQSLVIMDEFGRGTSTYDGAALAAATLNYLKSKVGCLLLFVTHYPEVMETVPDCNYHMGYHIVREDEEAEGKLIFLYTVMKGGASSSYGLNVARMAGIPGPIIKVAKDFAERVRAQRIIKREMRGLLQNMWSDDQDEVNNALNEIGDLHVPWKQHHDAIDTC